MKNFISRRRMLVVIGVLIAVGSLALVANAGHSWGSYHWFRTLNPFTVSLGDNVSTAWDAYLVEASSDWSVSSVLDTAVVSGSTTGRKCRAADGRVEVCSERYGFNGWLGVASIWVSGDHIIKGTVKVNDSYFNTSTYNTPAWRRLVMCQEVGHTFGLDHQDVNFTNSNLGTCMDYTNNPSGPPSNEHPNVHDYEQLEAIYSHLDSTALSVEGSRRNGKPMDVDGGEWGRGLSRDSRGGHSLYVRDLGGDNKVFTFVIWAE